MATVPLSPKLTAKVHELFPEDGNEVITLLERECGNNLPLLESGRKALILRVRCAVLKVSGGSKQQLLAAIDLAKRDWRDALMRGGFGEDLNAHYSWLGQRPPLSALIRGWVCQS